MAFLPDEAHKQKFKRLMARRVSDASCELVGLPFANAGDDRAPNSGGCPRVQSALFPMV